MGEKDLFTPAPPRQKSILDARDEFNAALKHHHRAVCPVCERQASILKRSMNAGYAKALIAIFHVQRNNPGWIHLITELDYDVLGGEYGKLRHWGLLEKKTEQRKDKNPANGFYRITELGRAFVLNQAKVKDHLYIWNDAVVEVEGDTTVDVSIKDLASVEFNYEELLKGTSKPVSPGEVG